MKKPKAPIGQGAKLIALPQKKDNLVWPEYFAQMDPTERILFAFTAFRQPFDQRSHEFYAYDTDSFRYLDSNQPCLTSTETEHMLIAWKKVGLMKVGRYSNSYSFAEGAAEAYWQWLNKQANLTVVGLEPEQALLADLPGTMDNILTILVMVDQGEILVTLNEEINKHSVKRVMASLTEPAWPQKHFDLEGYCYWLFTLLNVFKWVREIQGQMRLTKLGSELPDNLRVEELLSWLLPLHLRANRHKGLYLVLPLLDRCTEWTSWTKLVENLIPADNVGYFYRKDRLFELLSPFRFLGLLDLGEYQENILVRATPLGQFLFPKLIRRQKLEQYAGEIKKLTDQVYPLDGPETAYVQPNFEILLPRSVPWKVRWELGQFAVLEQQDQMLKYRLDKTYLMNARKRGIQAENIINLLTKLSAYPLPENIVLTIQQWAESFGQVTFMKLSVRLLNKRPPSLRAVNTRRTCLDYSVQLRLSYVNQKSCVSF